jgi:hypothetical protein
VKDPRLFGDKFAERIAALERAIESLTLARNLRSSTIDDPGVLQVRTGNIVTALFGRLSDGLMGVVLRRQSGELAFSVQGNQQDPSTQFVALWDRAGNIIVSDDATSGQGLARPWLPVLFGPSAMPAGAPSTTSATFDTLWRTLQDKQHPRLKVVYMVQADADTAGEVQLWDGPTATELDLQVIEAGAYRYVYPPRVSVPGGFSADMDVQVRARRTAGTGVLRVQVFLAMGVQS